MKKNKLGLCALASCVLLGGCSLFPNLDFSWLPWGDKEEEKEKENPINLDDVPSTIYADEEVDLSTYIKIEGNKKYSISLSDESYDVAILSGKKITAFTEGAINYVVKCGDFEKSGVIQAQSALRKTLNEVSTKLKDDYSFYVPMNSTTLGVVTATDGYYYEETFGQLNDGTIISGGYIRGKDGKIYTFYEMNGGIQYYLTGQEADISAFDASLEDLAALDFEFDKENNLLVAKADEEGKVQEVVKNVAFISMDFENYGYAFSRVTIGKFAGTSETYGVEGIDGCLELTVYLTDSKKELVYGKQIIAPEYITNETLNDLIEEEVQPTPAANAGELLGGAIDKIISKKNFTVSYASFFYDKQKNKEIPNPYGGDEFSNLIIHAYASAGANVYVTEDQVLKVVDGEPELTEGIISHDGKVYSYFYQGEDQVNEVLANTDDIFSPVISRKDNMTFMGNERGEDVWENVFINEISEEKGTTTAFFSGYTAHELLNYFCFVALNQTEDKEKVTFSSTIETLLNETYKFYMDYDIQGVITTKNGAVTGVSFDCVMFLSDTVYHDLQIVIGDVGTTEIPDGYDVVFGE